MKQPRSKWWYAAIATIVFAIVDQFNLLLKLIGWKRFISEWLIVLGIRNFFEVATALLAVAVTHRFGFKRAARELGSSRRSAAGWYSQRSPPCRC